MAKLADEMASRGIVILGLCDDSAEAQKKIAEPAGVGYPLLIEAEEMPPPFDDVQGFPSFLLVGRDGRVIAPLPPILPLVRRALYRLG